MKPFVACLLALIPVSCITTPPESRPTEVVLNALENHQVVAVGENHGHLELHDWILELLESPGAQEAIDDIVVEWGNALYQDQIDRFIAGEDVPFDSVSMAWRNTIVSPNAVWDAPVYERFFRRLRELNLVNDSEHQYRVVLGDTPVNWNRVESREDLLPFFDRAKHIAERVRQESLLKGRHSLLLAGGLHVSKLPRRRIRDDGVPIGEITPVAWLTLQHPGSVYVIQSMGRAAELGLTQLVISGNPVAVELSYNTETASIRANQTSTLRNMDGTKSDVYGTNTLGDIVDAVILWDTTEVTLQDAAPVVFQNDTYWEALNRRSQILRGRPMDDSLRVK